MIETSDTGFEKYHEKALNIFFGIGGLNPGNPEYKKDLLPGNQWGSKRWEVKMNPELPEHVKTNA